MNYWLFCLPRADLEHCMKIGVFGLPRRNLISKVCEGDKIVCCAAKGEWKILGLGTATSDYYVDDENIFLKEGVFVDRIKFDIKPVSKEFDIISILDQLSFITNLAYWAVYFRNGIVKMNKSDWSLIEKSIHSTI
jgi:predicted RNA-binding protein